MKKRNIVTLLLGLTFLLSTSSLIIAQSPSYVGVQVGDSHVWTLEPNIVNINETGKEILGEENYTLYYNAMIQTLENQTGLAFENLTLPQLTMNVTGVSSEMNVTADISAVMVNYTLFANDPTNESAPLEEVNKFSSYLINPSTLNESTYPYTLETLFSGGLLLAPLNLDMNLMADTIYKTINSSYYSQFNESVGNKISVETSGYGLSFTVDGDFVFDSLNESTSFQNVTKQLEISTFEDFSFEMVWDSSTGILDHLSFSYGGDEMISLRSGTGLEIPGFNLPLILATSSISLVGLVFLLNRKRR